MKNKKNILKTKQDAPKGLRIVQKFYTNSFLFDVVSDKLPQKRFFLSELEKENFIFDFENFLEKTKEHLLEAVFYSCACEARHGYSYCFNNHYSKYIKKERFGDVTFTSNIFQECGRDSAPKRALRIFKGNRRDAMIAFRDAFAYPRWDSCYGGSPWKNGAEGWIRLFNAKNNKEIISAIDHVYDLQHNSGLLFNKHGDYSNKIKVERPLRKILNAKRKAVSFNELVYLPFYSNHCSKTCFNFLNNRDTKSVIKIGYKTGYWETEVKK